MPAPQNLQEFITKFKEIKQMGYIKTHRAGDTGIGKTLEDLLEIKENNIQGPDFADYELKVMRTGANCLLSLFSKSPQPPKINRLLLDTYGYASCKYGNNKKVLHSMLTCGKWTPCDGSGRFLSIQYNKDCDRIEVIDKEQNVPCWWQKDMLEAVFAKKYKNKLIHCFAQARGKGKNEEFLFTTAQELGGFDFENMIKLIQAGDIKIDIRIGQHKNGTPHDHGTGFRITENKLPLLFKEKTVLVE